MGTSHKRKADRQALQNRELSWLQFNQRVLAEADNPDNPLLERAKFLAIVTSNLDEFLQVRYQRVYEAAKGKHRHEKVEGGVSAEKLYQRINKEILRQNNLQYLLYEGVRSELYLAGVRLFPTFSLDAEDHQREKALFEKEIRPYLKVEELENSRPRQKQLYLCVKVLRAHQRKAQFKLIGLPTALPRLFDLSRSKDVQCLIRLEDVVKHHVHRMFPKDEVEHVAVFRILRNQHFEIEESTEDDIVPAVRAMLAKRPGGDVMRLEAEERMSEEMLTLLMRKFSVELERRYRVTGPLDLNKLLMSLYGLIKRPELKYPAAQPKEIPELMGEDAFDAIDRQDWLLYHPYHSFSPIVHLMQLAADDPTVRAVRQTLYRVSGNSPIVAALARAAENGKQVTVLVELKARFDEENNILWARRLEKAGCHVIYGLVGLKTHAKIILIVRKEDNGIKRYLHLGTGNYNDSTAKLYTDLGLMTANDEFGSDASAFFNLLSGYSEPPVWNKLVMAPLGLREKIYALIDNEIEMVRQGKEGHIVAKMNSLIDQPVIQKLYEASAAGVHIDLIIRGICGLRTGIEGISDNITVRSIVGRQLEHSRIFWFANGGEEQLYLSSADWMPRNLNDRVELFFPVETEEHIRRIKGLLDLYLRDNVGAHMMQSNGTYRRVHNKLEPVSAQSVLYEMAQLAVTADKLPMEQRLQPVYSRR